jgi:hypothetical protein
LQADEQRAVVNDAIKKVFLKVKLQAISLGSSKDTKDNSLLADEANLIAAVTKCHRNYNIHTPFHFVFLVQLSVAPDLKKESRQPLMVIVQTVHVCNT